MSRRRRNGERSAERQLGQVCDRIDPPQRIEQPLACRLADLGRGKLAILAGDLGIAERMVRVALAGRREAGESLSTDRFDLDTSCALPRESGVELGVDGKLDPAHEV